MFPGNIRRSAAFFSLANRKNQKGYRLSLIHLLSLHLSLSISLSMLITLRRQCQGHEFCPHHYLLITVFVQARSVGGNRWCVCVCDGVFSPPDMHSLSASGQSRHVSWPQSTDLHPSDKRLSNSFKVSATAGAWDSVWKCTPMTLGVFDLLCN